MFPISQRKITSSDITSLLGEWSVLLEAGMSLDEALSLTQLDQEKPALAALIGHIQTEIRQGKQLAAVLAAYPQYLPEFITDLIKQAELEQRLPILLTSVANYRDSSEAVEINVSQRIKAAMAYPTSVLLVATAVMTLLAVFVMPAFISLYQGFNAQLPLFTLQVIAIISIIQSYWWTALPIAAFAFALIRSSKNPHGESTSGLYNLKMFLALRLPGLGKIYHTMEIIRSLHTWGFMLAHGASVDQALEASVHMVHTPMYANTMRKMCSSVASGTPLTVVLQQHNILPNKVKRALLIATHSNDKRQLLVKLADRYTQYTKLRFEQNLSIFNLILLCVVWTVVGIMVIATYLPIFQIAVEL